MKRLAKHIEHELQRGLWQHCTVYEDELQRLWAREAPYREARIAVFAEKYGFRLRFYQKGLCAIFDNGTSATENVSVPRQRKAEGIFGTGSGDSCLRAVKTCRGHRKADRSL